MADESTHDPDPPAVSGKNSNYLCNLWRDSITEHFPNEALLAHVARESAGPLESIFQPLQFYIRHCIEEEKREISVNQGTCSRKLFLKTSL